MVLKHGKSVDEVVKDWYEMYVAAQKLYPDFAREPGYVKLIKKYRMD
jgi:hypothetical protein